MKNKIKSNIKGLNIKTLYSWSEDYFLRKKLLKKNRKKKFKIVFSGNIGDAQNLINLVKAIKYIQKKNNKIEWLFVGDGSKKKWLNKQLKFLNIKSVKFLDHRSTNLIPRIYKTADAGLISLQKGSTFNNTLPAKFQSYLAYGLPIFTFALGESLNLTKKYKLGLYCEPDNPKKFALQIIRFSNLSKKKINLIMKNNQNVYKHNFSKKKAIQIVCKEIKNLVK